jgi:hypothetical protein
MAAEREEIIEVNSEVAPRMKMEVSIAEMIQQL